MRIFSIKCQNVTNYYEAMLKVYVHIKRRRSYLHLLLEMRIVFI